MSFDPEADALRLDAYLDRLLATRGVPTAVPDAGAHDDPSVQGTAGILRRHLVRFHPSFLFEDRLAARLHGAAAGGARLEPAGPARILPFRAPDGGGIPPAAPHPGAHAGRGLLVGGAIASGVSLAGAALFAWRRTHPPAGPFRRAARAAHALGSGVAAGQRPRVRRERLA